jgi:hypothetical protein
MYILRFIGLWDEMLKTPRRTKSNKAKSDKSILTGLTGSVEITLMDITHRFFLVHE